MIKTYEYDYNNGEASASFLVDTEKFTPDMAKELLSFFVWYYDTENDPLDEVMKKYALQAIRFATYNGHNKSGVISDFEEEEGWSRVDGSEGITLTEVTEYEFDDRFLTITCKEL